MEGVGGFGVGGGFKGSGFVAGLGAVGCEAGAGAAVGVGAETGVVVGLVGGCSVEGLVEAVEDVGVDLLAQVLGYDGAGGVVLVGSGLVG